MSSLKSFPPITIRRWLIYSGSKSGDLEMGLEMSLAMQFGGSKNRLWSWLILDSRPGFASDFRHSFNFPSFSFFIVIGGKQLKNCKDDRIICTQYIVFVPSEIGETYRQAQRTTAYWSRNLHGNQYGLRKPEL